MKSVVFVVALLGAGCIGPTEPIATPRAAPASSADPPPLAPSPIAAAPDPPVYDPWRTNRTWEISPS